MNFFFLTLTKYRINPGLFAYFFLGGVRVRKFANMG